MKNFAISDTHFHHTNIISYCSRPFYNVKHMNETLIENWNNTVAPEDTVYHVGDFAFGQYDAGRQILEKLNGHKILILGNHDRAPVKMEEMGFNEVYKCLHVNYKGTRILFTHYPKWDPMFPFVYQEAPHDFHIYGHVHNNPDYIGWNVDVPSKNVSVEMINYRPMELDAIVGGFTSF